MSEPLLPTPDLPGNMSEYHCVMLHGPGFKVMMDGLDCYIYEMSDDRGSLRLLFRTAGSSHTERLAIALLRAAAVQRECEQKRA
jgi:hypothetical protein